MKVIILILLFSMTVHAQNYRAVEAVGVDTTFTKIQDCVSSESGKTSYKGCFDVSGKDMRKWKVGLVDDLSSPKYNKRGIVACTDQPDCQTKLEAIDCSSYAEGSFAVIKGDYTEVYCAEPNGYNQKDGLVNDPVGEAAAIAADAQTASDKSTRDTAKGPRETSLQTCVQDSKNPTLSPSQIKDCINSLVREVLGDKVNINDL